MLKYIPNLLWIFFCQLSLESQGTIQVSKYFEYLIVTWFNLFEICRRFDWCIDLNLMKTATVKLLKLLKCLRAFFIEILILNNWGRDCIWIFRCYICKKIYRWVINFRFRKVIESYLLLNFIVGLDYRSLRLRKYMKRRDSLRNIMFRQRKCSRTWRMLQFCFFYLTNRLKFLFC